MTAVSDVGAVLDAEEVGAFEWLRKGVSKDGASRPQLRTQISHAARGGLTTV